MSNRRYGQTLTWGTGTAPHLFTGVCTGYSYRGGTTRLIDKDESGDPRAIIEHSKKAAIEFSAKITDGSTNFLNLAAGAAIVVSGIGSGTVLVSKAVERWVLNQQKRASISATHYPDIVQAEPVLAGSDLSAFTPDQSALTIVTPGELLIYSTYGMTHESGIIHELTLEQLLTITEDDIAPDGTIKGASANGYMRTIQLKLLATGAKPAEGTTLALTGGPDHAADFLIETSEEIFEEERGKMYDIGGVWIPPFTEE